jgi:hypothetical protein
MKQGHLIVGECRVGVVDDSGVKSEFLFRCGALGLREIIQLFYDGYLYT